MNHNCGSHQLENECHMAWVCEEFFLTTLIHILRSCNTIEYIKHTFFPHTPVNQQCRTLRCCIYRFLYPVMCKWILYTRKLIYHLLSPANANGSLTSCKPPAKDCSVPFESHGGVNEYLGACWLLKAQVVGGKAAGHWHVMLVGSQLGIFQQREPGKPHCAQEQQMGLFGKTSFWSSKEDNNIQPKKFEILIWMYIMYIYNWK